MVACSVWKPLPSGSVVGSISDYVGSRWGRRRPFILVGSLLAAASLAGLALAPSFPLLLLFFLSLQLTANIARGPFAGLVPDLVPRVHGSRGPQPAWMELKPSSAFRAFSTSLTTKLNWAWSPQRPMNRCP